MKFNEDTRVKIPTILHLIRLGYNYLSLKEAKWDLSTNIFTEIFSQNIKKINPGLNDSEIKLFYDEVSLSLENKDLGKAFYEKLEEEGGAEI